MKYCCDIKLRRLITLVVISALVFFMPFSVNAKEKDSDIKKHVRTHDIAIVYDTSGSMYDDGNDAWSQALYAIEVFASMMDYENGDRLGIYPMGDICITKEDEKHKTKERMEISSKDDIAKIEQIYVPVTSPTVFEPVYRAQEYLEKSDADEKWLIVLTDGAFYREYDKEEDRDQAIPADWVSSHLQAISEKSDIKVQFLGFASANELQGDSNKNFYATKANDSADLTNKLVDICNQIFQRDVISDINEGSFNTDVSMNSIIVFAQGENAKITSLKNAKGKEIKQLMDTSLNANKLGAGNRLEEQRVADVSGQVVTFDSCQAGDYTLSYSGSNVQVFYEPNVEIKVALKNENGEELDLSKAVEAGEYTLEYGLIDGVTGKSVSDSALLNPINMGEAVVENNGESKKVASGGKITLEPDSETFINIKGEFLNKYEVSTMDNSEAYIFDVQPRKKHVEMKFLASPDYIVTTDGLLEQVGDEQKEDISPIIMHTTLEGAEFTAEEWEAAPIPEVKAIVSEDDPKSHIFNRYFKVQKYEVKKGDNIGDYVIYPTLKRVSSSGTYAGTNIEASYELKNDKADWEGTSQGRMNLTDTRNWLQRHWELFIHLAILAVIVVILLGYVPPFKKYLPRSMKRKPTIICKPNGIGKSKQVKGSFSKDTVSTLIPYKPETGTLKFLPPGVGGLPSMKLKAAGGSRIAVTNVQPFAGQPGLTINGAPVADNAKTLYISPNAMIRVTIDNMKYTCIPKS